MGKYSSSLCILLGTALISAQVFAQDPIEVQTRTNALRTILDQPNRIENAGFCKTMPAELRPPAELITVLEQINLAEPPAPDQVRSLIIKNTETPAHGTQEIDLHSPIYLMAQESGLRFSNLERPSWFSGGNDKNYRLPKSDSFGNYFKTLFSKITEAAIPWNPTVLSRSDLFHGHMIYHRGLKDLLIVFHAKEYPRENPSLCAGCSMRKLFDFFGLHLPAQIKTQPASDSYLRRNFVISLGQGKLCGANTRVRAFAALAQGQGDGSTLDAAKASDLGKAGEIMNINFFASEDVPIFFDILRATDAQ